MLICVDPCNRSERISTGRWPGGPHKDISEETKARICNFFESGLLASATYKELMKQLRSDCHNEQEYEMKLADRPIIPRKSDINRLYGQFTKKMFGSCNIESMFIKLEKRIEELLELSEDYTFQFIQYNKSDGQPLIYSVKDFGFLVHLRMDQALS